MSSEKTEGLDEFVENCLRDEFARMAEDGFEPPLTLTIEDEDGVRATAQVNDDWAVEWERVVERAPKIPFVVKVVDCNRKGAELKFLAAN